MGDVYRAWDERLKREVAVKLIAEWLAGDPVFARRFRREAELGACLAHPNIVAVHDAGGAAHPYIVMEFVDGVHAGKLVAGRPAAGDAVHVVAQVCDALAYAHDNDVVHRDVSLRNILITRRDRTAKLADFGLASRSHDAPAGRAVNVMGTPGYVAPEVLGGARPSPHSDLYSLAVVAYRLLGGRSGARTSDAGATAPQVTSVQRMPPLAEARPDLPPALIEAVQRGLAHDPDDRQESVGQFRAELLDAQVAPLRLVQRELRRAA
jgi:serine/threonine-protein kinase